MPIPVLIVVLEQLVLRCPLLLPSHQEPRRVRELSIHLFKDVMEAVVGSRDEQVEEQVHRSLLPLVFHLHDEILNVAQVWISNQGLRSF